MKRLKDGFLDIVDRNVPLRGKLVLEIGCGNGSRSVQIAKRCKSLVAIDPSPELINDAMETNLASNINYQVGLAESLKFNVNKFDLVIFTLSFHHVDSSKRETALNNAFRVVKTGGYVIFFEPAAEGSFFDAELEFDACDGDERKAKRLAYSVIKNNKFGEGIIEEYDETVLRFDSFEDFVENMNPKKNLSEIKDFLEKHDYQLNAIRRINIYKVS